jgi:hypothetical protein
MRLPTELVDLSWRCPVEDVTRALLTVNLQAQGMLERSIPTPLTAAQSCQALSGAQRSTPGVSTIRELNHTSLEVMKSQYSVTPHRLRPGIIR